ncbi:MAG: D-sedoheptulose 7-phosphate isomerase [Bacteroidota bacterium]
MLIRDIIKQSFLVKQMMLLDIVLQTEIQKVADKMIEVYKKRGKILLCGNGGSAADAQHIAAELSGRFYYDRPPLYAEALHVNTSYLTAVANDYSFDVIYSRLVEAMGKPGDMLIGLSTSGNSTNIIKALEVAKNQNLICIGMTGSKGGKMKDSCDYLLAMPSGDTPRVQEAHILVGHILCQLVESAIFPQ